MVNNMATDEELREAWRRWARLIVLTDACSSDTCYEIPSCSVCEYDDTDLDLSCPISTGDSDFLLPDVLVNILPCHEARLQWAYEAGWLGGPVRPGEE